MNPYYIEIMLEERKREMVAEARRIQMLAAYEADRPTPMERLLKALGKTLINMGEKLVQRCNHGDGLHGGLVK